MTECEEKVRRCFSRPATAHSTGFGVASPAALDAACMHQASTANGTAAPRDWTARLDVRDQCYTKRHAGREMQSLFLGPCRARVASGFVLYSGIYISYMMVL
jgi:hypothetical protein